MLLLFGPFVLIGLLYVLAGVFLSPDAFSQYQVSARQQLTFFLVLPLIVLAVSIVGAPILIIATMIQRKSVTVTDPPDEEEQDEQGQPKQSR